ncbi:hypothetical protein BJY01DRAFT_124663 [Aspergillus pseudoustus]|uniref:Uncharacterized protein n=1 Tax=Aspergillus pseudoustus TaxID=1810923 RepID=A0ABR4INN2_9EURO
MATQRVNYYHDGQPQFAPTYARQTLDYELASDQDLASSRPISLADLYTITNSSRNKASKKLRGLFTAKAGYMEYDAGDILDRFDPREPYSRHPSTQQYKLSNETGHLTPPPRFVSQEYPWQRHGTRTEVGQEQSWHPQLNDYQAQRNPLSLASYGNPSQSRNHSGMSESPFLRRTDQTLLDNEDWSVEAAPQTTQFDTTYSQKTQQFKGYIPTSSLQLYRDSFDRRQDKPPYEPLRLKHRNNRTDLPSITSGLQYGHHPESGFEQYTGNTTIRSEPTTVSACRSRFPNIFESLESMKETLSAAKPLEDFEPPKVPATHSRLSSETGISQRTIKEEIYAILGNLSIGPNTGSQLTSSPQDSASTEMASVSSDELQGPDDRQSPIPSEVKENSSLESGPVGDDVIVPKEEVSAAEATEEDEELPIPLSEADQQRLIEYYENDFPRMAKQLPVSSCAHESSHGTIKPPPGLSRRLSAGRTVPFETSSWLPEINKQTHADDNREEKCLIPLAAQARLLEVDEWFSTDNRGEGALRRHIANIADNYVESRERLNKQVFSERDNTTTKQLITTFGGVLANLLTYDPQEPKDPGRYFAKFSPVESRYYEPPMGGQRSYFDRRSTFDYQARRMGEASLDDESGLH